MKEEWKVYIKGVQGRGEEVKQALINLGGYVVRNYNYTVSYCLYYINHNGEIRCAEKTTEIGKIIMDNYTELHLPEKWNDGDLLVAYSTGVGKLYAVYSDLYAVYSDDSEFMNYFIITYVSVTIDTYDVNAMFSKDRFKLASDEEHKEFYDLLHKHGVDWDAEKKQVVDWKWKPKDGEDYYYIISNGIVHLSTWFDYKVDNSRFSIGNCFKTKEEAEIMAEKFKKLLKDNL